MDASDIKEDLAKIDELLNKEGANVDDFLKQLQDGKMGSIQEVIDEINEMIGEREKLSKNLINDLDKISSNINNMSNSYNSPEAYAELLRLKQKQVDLEITKVNEQLNCWRDVALLKRELRERMKDFRDQQSKISMLDNLLENK